MSVQKKPFYVTTPIYYVNDVPHIGHAYTTVAADCIARYQRLRGRDVRFLTGTDEHGQKVEKAALAAGVTPMEFADGVVARYKELWGRLNISYDDFIRTTEPRHKAAVEALWDTVVKNGDIELGTYEDWYCTPCENFLTELQLKEGKCPDCGRPVEKLKEESYFFKLSKFGVELLRHIESNPGFIQPDGKRKEIVSFLEGGLRDLSVSRTTFTWGIGVPGNPKHVMYVWFDALTNYLSSLGYPDEIYKEYWSGEVVHIIGKDILRFHSVYWPAFLISAGIELPSKILVHGWWTVDGQKMSKSKGNVVDPNVMIDKFGADQFRYFLLREMPFGGDGDFSVSAITTKINSDLANDLGNLLSRSVAMIIKYREGKVPEPNNRIPANSVVITEITNMMNCRNDAVVKYVSCMRGYEFYEALEYLWTYIRSMNGLIEKTAPWKLYSEETTGTNDKSALDIVLYVLAEELRTTAVFIYPFMPVAANEIWKSLGIGQTIDESIARHKANDKDPLSEEVEKGSFMAGCTVIEGNPHFPDKVEGGDPIAGCKVTKGDALFPRIV